MVAVGLVFGALMLQANALQLQIADNLSAEAMTNKKATPFYTCHKYSDGQSDDWCKSAGEPYVFTQGNNNNYPGCSGECWCCEKTPWYSGDDGWSANGGNDGGNEWCEKGPIYEGYEYKWFGANGPCGSSYCCKSLAPTPAPTPEPTPEPETVSASGDPHVVNVVGERFNLWRLGKVELLRIPRNSAKPLLHMVANVSELANVDDAGHHTYNDCAEAPYMTDMHLTLHQNNISISLRENDMVVHLNQKKLEPSYTPYKCAMNWRQFDGEASILVQRDFHVKISVGDASIDVVQPRQPAHFFLNMAARRLGSLGFDVGGVLGLDDHTDVAQRPAHCPRTLAQASQSDSSVAGFKVTASLS